MARPAGSGPANARTLLRALTELGAAPVPDPKQRPHGVQPRDAPLLLGVLLAKAELDAAELANPDLDPPDGLSELLVGYQGVTSSSESCETELKLLTLRLVRTAVELTLVEDHDPLIDAACNAALAAGNLVNCYRIRRYTRADPRAAQHALDSADQFTHDLARAMTKVRRAAVHPPVRRHKTSGLALPRYHPPTKKKDAPQTSNTSPGRKLAMPNDRRPSATAHEQSDEYVRRSRELARNYSDIKFKIGDLVLQAVGRRQEDDEAVQRFADQIGANPAVLVRYAEVAASCPPDRRAPGLLFHQVEVRRAAPRAVVGKGRKRQT